MVKKAKKAPSPLEKRFIRQPDEQDEEFIKASEFLTNDALNDDDENLNQTLLDEKDDLLIEKLRSLDGRKTKRLRTEVVNNEFDVNITNNDSNEIHKIKTYELLNSISNISEAGTLKKIFAKTHKRTKTLETPLPKFITDKAQRIASYAENKKEVTKWDPVVKKNRRADQLVFPLKQPDYSMQTVANVTKNWKMETELEKQIAELLETSENNLKDQKLLTAAETKALQSMNLDEMKQKREEFLKLRAQQTYQESKFKRMKNIKSKRYRKILRKEKEKLEQKDMDKMEKEDPMQFKEALDRIEKQRIKERMSLKHKNTSKWAKKQNSYAKYNDQARELVQEQLDLSRQLTKKLKPVNTNDSDDEGAASNQQKGSSESTGPALSQLNLQSGLLVNNPWMKMMGNMAKVAANGKSKTDEDEDEENTDEYAKPKAYTNKIELYKAKVELEKAENEEDDGDDDEDYTTRIDRSNIQDVKVMFEDNDDSDGEEESKPKPDKVVEKIAAKPGKRETQKQQKEQAKLESPPLAFQETKTEKAVNNNIKPLYDNNKITFNKIDHLDQGDQQQNGTGVKLNLKANNHQISLSEAFADDDVIEEFRAEKRATMENEKVKTVDLVKPGWGGWAGAGIDMEEAKRKILKKSRRNNRRTRHKLIIRPQDLIKTEEDKKLLVRRDKNLDHVIISEKKDAMIAKYQISELPHQYKSVSDFEQKIAQPIGRTWNPDFKFRKLIMPKVKTKLGAIITPIDKTDLANSIKRKS